MIVLVNMPVTTQTNLLKLFFLLYNRHLIFQFYQIL